MQTTKHHRSPTSVVAPLLGALLIFLGTTGIQGCDEHINLDPRRNNPTASPSGSPSGSPTGSPTGSVTPTPTDDELVVDDDSELLSSEMFSSTFGGDTAETDSTGMTGPDFEIDNSIGTDPNDLPEEQSANDQDRDRLPDEEESAAGTDPSNPDTDGDGFIDGFEVENGFDPLDPNSRPISSELMADTPDEVFALRKGRGDRDGDGVPDSLERKLGSSLDNPDTDEDGMYDGVELLNGTDLRVADEERPTDRDGDGLFDKTENKLNTPISNADLDRDLLPDTLELLFSTNPRNPDTDRDGILDGRDLRSGSYRFTVSTFDFSNS